jgi:hypothetical protein
MNCSLDEVRNLILWAILCLSIAIGLAYAWVAAFPLFAAAALVAAVSFYFIPLAFISSWILSWLGVSMQVAVAYLVNSGIGACAAVIAILLGVLADAYNYKSCMDQAGSGSVAI